ncbi:hypothetical protein J6590_048970 [Homalodisca vitripennis]|nr:hypothetical protein J6590_048970 [Homalodisca vitripennis]
MFTWIHTRTRHGPERCETQANMRQAEKYATNGREDAIIEQSITRSTPRSVAAEYLRWGDSHLEEIEPSVTRRPRPATGVLMDGRHRHARTPRPHTRVRTAILAKRVGIHSPWCHNVRYHLL